MNDPVYEMDLATKLELVVLEAILLAPRKERVGLVWSE